jgi:MarR family transcriptional regulator, organic hydroperoxide resistance regulator
MQDDPVRASLPHALVRLFRYVNRAHNRALGAYELTAEQAHVLALLWQLGPQTIGQLQRQLALSSPTLTGAITRMEAQRLVRRAPSPTDKRVTVIEAAPATLRRQRGIEAVLAETEDHCFKALTAAERKTLLELMDKCIASFDAGS